MDPALPSEIQRVLLRAPRVMKEPHDVVWQHIKRLVQLEASICLMPSDTFSQLNGGHPYSGAASKEQARSQSNPLETLTMPQGIGKEGENQQVKYMCPGYV